MALIAQLGEHCTGIAEVVGSNPAQSLNFFQVSVLVVFNGRTCINYRYHSIATMGQIIFTIFFFLSFYNIKKLNLFCSQIFHPQRGGHLRNSKKVDQMLLCFRYISLLFNDWNSASMPLKSIFLATSVKAD